MALTMASNLEKKRELPESVRVEAQRKLDEALGLFERGSELWINTGFLWTSSDRPGVKVDIWLKDDVV